MLYMHAHHTAAQDGSTVGAELKALNIILKMVASMQISAQRRTNIWPTGLGTTDGQDIPGLYDDVSPALPHKHMPYNDVCMSSLCYSAWGVGGEY
jgi:hypothetical protein